MVAKLLKPLTFLFIGLLSLSSCTVTSPTPGSTSSDSSVVTKVEHSVSVAEASHSRVFIDKEKAYPGEIVSITAYPDGTFPGSIKVSAFYKDDNGETKFLTLIEKGSVFTFEMPNSDVNVLCSVEQGSGGGGGSSSQPDPDPVDYDCTVSFVTNGEKIDPIVVHNGKKLKLPADPTRSGYRFDGWFLDENFLEAFNSNLPITSSITLYAKWTANTYKIDFDLNGGSGEFAAQYVNYLDTASKPSSDPTKDGYSFSGWFFDNELFDFSTPVTLDLTLTANWTIKEYTIKFDVLGQSSIPEQIIKHGEFADEPIGPNREGYTFIGWDTIAGNEERTQLFERFDFNKQKITTDLVLYAKWVKSEYNVVFSLGYNAHEDSLIPNQSLQFGDRITKPIDPIREGYDFICWHLKDTDEPFDFDNEIITSKVVLYAKWLPKSYRVSFVDNDLVIDEQIVEYGNKVIFGENPEKSGHTFAGWFIDKDLKQPFNKNNNVDSDLTLYAKWTQNNYSLNILDNNNNVLSTISDLHYGDLIKDVDYSVSVIGYDAEGYYLDNDYSNPVDNNFTITDNTNIFVKLIKKAYVVDFMTNSVSSEIASIEVNYGELITQPNNPVKEGHSFAGWYYDPQLTTPWIFESQTVSEDITLYAKWEKQSFSINFDVDCSNVTPPSAITAEYGEVVDLPTIIREGYTLVGWKYNNETYNSFTVPANNVTLVAVWSKNTHLVKLFDNDVLYSTYQFEYGDDIILDEIPEKEGYTFIGFDGELPDKMPDSDISLSILWTINQYVVSFETNGGTLIDSIYVNYNGLVEKPENNPSREGYSFIGWFTDENYNNEFKFDETHIISNTTIYAGWLIESYSVSFIVDGLVYSRSMGDYGDDVEIPQDPSKEGYTFHGWDKEVPLSIPAEDVTLNAIFERNSYQITFMDGEEVYYSSILKYGEEIINPNNPIKVGYTFLGWDKEVPEVMGAANLVFNAKWNYDNYSINFYVDDELYHSIVGHYGDSLQLPSNPSKNGYDFAGWDIAVPSIIPANDLSVYAKWNAKKYTVYFNTDGGSYIEPVIADYNEKISKPVNPTKDGYLFIGWYKEDSHNTSWEFSSDVVQGDITLFALYSASQYMITYETFGGSEVLPTGANYGDAISKPTDPTKYGYSFVDWCVDEECLIPYSFTTMPSQSFTLYAKWAINQYTITFDTKGGNAIDSITQEYNSDIIIPNNPTKNGYSFAGWDRDIPEKMLGEDITISALWAPLTYNISYNLNGGSLVSENPSTYTIESDDIVLKNPNRNGYVFAGWQGTNLDEPSTEVIILKGSYGDRNYTANWIPLQYTISFISNGGSEVESLEVNYDELVPSPTNPTKEGYNFGGWFKEAELNNPWDFSTDKVAGDTTLYAKWTTGEFVITFISDGKTYRTISQKYGTTINPPSNPSKIGYTFVSWDKEIPLQMPSENMTIEAIFAVNQYTISFISNGGSEVESLEVNYDELVPSPTNPTKEGYNFGGWFKEAELNNPWDFSTDKVAGDTTLYAKWDPISYKIKFNSNGGSNISSINANYGENISSPDDPIKTGYNFGGWFKEAELNNPWDFSTDKVAGPITLFAKWVGKTLEVTYDGNGSDNGAMVKDILRYGDNTTLAANVYQKTGHTFAGWNTKADGSGDNYDDSCVLNSTLFVNKENFLTLYAQWNAGTCYVTFNTMGGSTIAKSSVSYSQKITKPSDDPTKEGYEFKGWFKEETCINEWNFNVDTVVSNITLYAKWEVINLSRDITYVDSNQYFQIEGPDKADVGDQVTFSISKIIRGGIIKNIIIENADSGDELMTIEPHTPFGEGDYSFVVPNANLYVNIETLLLTSHSIVSNATNITMSIDKGYAFAYAGETIGFSVDVVKEGELEVEAKIANQILQLTKSETAYHYTFDVPSSGYTKDDKIIITVTFIGTKYSVGINNLYSCTEVSGVDLENGYEEGSTVNYHVNQLISGDILTRVFKNGSEQQEVSVTNKGNGNYSFIMPNYSVDIWATVEPYTTTPKLSEYGANGYKGLIKDPNFNGGFIARKSQNQHEYYNNSADFVDLNGNKGADGTGSYIFGVENGQYVNFVKNYPGNAWGRDRNLQPYWHYTQWMTRFEVNNNPNQGLKNAYGNTYISKIDNDVDKWHIGAGPSENNLAKDLIFNSKTGEFTMNVNTDKEYENGMLYSYGYGQQWWIHFLIEQEFFGNDLIKVSECSSIIVDIGYIINYDNYIRDVNGQLANTSQVEFYLTLQDQNKAWDPNSPNYMWFGFDLYDSRKSYGSGISGELGSGVAIYKPNVNHPNVGNEHRITLDITNTLKTAYNQAVNNGFMANTSFNNLVIGAFNIGYEVHGARSTSVTFHDLNIYYK